MAIPSVRSTSTPTVDAVGGVTSKTVAVPSGSAAGDLFQVQVTLQWNIGGSPGDPAMTGFDLIASNVATSGTRANRTAVFAAKRTGSEGATFTVSSINSSVTYILITAQCIQDADTSGTIAAALDGTAATNTASGGVSSIALPSVTTTQADSGAFSTVACYSNVIASDPSTWTQVDSGDGGFLEVYRKAMAAAGATGTDTAGTTSEQAVVAAAWAWKSAVASGGVPAIAGAWNSGRRRI